MSINSRRLLSYTFITAVSALPLLQGCAVNSGAGQTGDETPTQAGDDAVDKTSPDFFYDGVSITTVATGTGWKKIRMKGSAADDTGKTSPVDKELMVITADTGIADAPLPSAARKDLESDLARRKSTATAAAPDDEITIVDLEKANEIQASAKPGAAALTSCSNYDKVVSKSLSTTKTKTFNKTTEAGSFTGAINIVGTLTASASAKATFRVKTAGFVICVPYSVSFKKVELAGNATVTAKVDMNADFAKEYHYNKVLAAPQIGSLSFWAGPIPVYLKFTVPIEAGIDASAKAKLTLNGALEAKGQFNVTCTKTSCDGSRSATHGWVNNAPPTIAANAKVDIAPYAQASLRAAVYDDAVGFGQVGVRGTVSGDLWGYAGNTCGDGDGNGSPEYVTAATLNARALVDVRAKAEFFGSSLIDKKWTVLDKHLGFWDLGSSSAFSPIVKLTQTADMTAQADIKMRPCWPYRDDAMKYRITWGDGTTEDVTGDPDSLLKTHGYGTWGVKVVSITPLADSKGRGPGKAASKSIKITPVFVPGGGEFDPG